MMLDWTEAPLEAFLTRLTYGFTNPMPTTAEGPYMVTARDVNDGRILYESARRTSKSAFENDITDKCRPNIGDVLVTKDGTLGRIAVVDRANVCINQSVALLQPSELIKSRFLKYLLEEPSNFARMLGDADGSTIKHIYITRLAKMAVRVPSVATQEAILDILGALDDKIELNRRMNETLEGMAQAIFRDWFVDFGPTRRKLAASLLGANGASPTRATDPALIMGGLTAPATSAALAALFPPTLGANGLPKGWAEQGLDEIATFLNGLALQKFPAVSQTDFLPVIKIAQLRNGVSSTSDKASRDLPTKYVVEDGDFLFSWSGSLLAKYWTGGQGALNQHLFKITSDSHPMWFVTQWVHHHMPEFQQIAASKATTMGHIQRAHLHAARVACPSTTTLALLGEVVEPLIRRTVHNDLESTTLAATRDLLLPKLMSGEIRLRDAEKLVEAAI